MQAKTSPNNNISTTFNPHYSVTCDHQGRVSVYHKKHGRLHPIPELIKFMQDYTVHKAYAASNMLFFQTRDGLLLGYGDNGSGILQQTIAIGTHTLGIIPLPAPVTRMAIDTYDAVYIELQAQNKETEAYFWGPVEPGKGFGYILGFDSTRSPYIGCAQRKYYGIPINPLIFTQPEVQNALFSVQPLAYYPKCIPAADILRDRLFNTNAATTTHSNLPPLSSEQLDMPMKQLLKQLNSPLTQHGSHSPTTGAHTRINYTP